MKTFEFILPSTSTEKKKENKERRRKKHIETSTGFLIYSPGSRGGMGGAGDPNRANQLFDSVQRLMGEFEAGLPRFERATQRAATVCEWPALPNFAD